MATFARSGSSLSIDRGAWIEATVSSMCAHVICRM
jgi:hypothetical protein